MMPVPTKKRWQRSVRPLPLAALALALCSAPAGAQPVQRAIADVDVQALANGVLGLMSFTVAPDVTTSSLSIENAATANPHLAMTQLGGGFTWSKSLPLYLEGNAAWARYDPVFLATDGAEQRPVPVQWDSLSVSGGIGWDFPLGPHWVLRPMLNLTYGRLTSDLAGAKWWLEENTNVDLASLDRGKLEAYGIGGSLMLDYERFAPEVDVDLELRYTNVKLRNSGTLAPDVDARASAESLSIWGRRRMPTGWVVWDRPVRYVLEGAYTRFLGSQTELGVDHMASLGAGIEFDSSAFDNWVTRWRAVARYKFGHDLAGWSVGLAISF